MASFAAFGVKAPPQESSRGGRYLILKRQFRKAMRFDELLIEFLETILDNITVGGPIRFVRRCLQKIAYGPQA
jgi:hypothetical protein